jgi:hypothetical protein
MEEVDKLWTSKEAESSSLSWLIGGGLGAIFRIPATFFGLLE